MIKKLNLLTLLTILALFSFACNSAPETEPPVAEVEPAAEVDESHADTDESHDMDMDDAAMDEIESEFDKIDGEMAESEGMDVVYTVDAASSTVTWKGSKAIGKSHVGGIDISEGSLTLVENQLVSGLFILDMNSLTSGDNGGTRLLDHLKSEDFFGVANYPTATLVIYSAESLGGDQYKVQGELTIKDKTNPIEFTATATEADGQVTASADIVFDRAQFDVQYGSGSFFSGLGDDLINDEVEMTVQLVAKK